MKILEYRNKPLFYGLNHNRLFGYDLIKLYTDSVNELFSTNKYFTVRNTGSNWSGVTFVIGSKLGTDLLQSISYSVDGGKSWETVQNINNSEVSIVIDSELCQTLINKSHPKNNEVLFKGLATQLGYYTGSSDYDMCSITSSSPFKISGNLMSLFYGDDFANQTEFAEGTLRNCYGLFLGNTNLVDASELILPAKVLTPGCYYAMFKQSGLLSAPQFEAEEINDRSCFSMFEACASLTRTPKIKATVINGAYGCSAMFQDCTNLTIATELPATTLGTRAYQGMFFGCTNLTKAPSVLPADVVPALAYQQIFKNCTSLTNFPRILATTVNNQSCLLMFAGCTGMTKAPVLSGITTLGQECYNSMFMNCTNLLECPELPVMTLQSACYASMFKGCTSITKTCALPANTAAVSCYNSMFSGCTSLVDVPEELHATGLLWSSYGYMFTECSSLTRAPRLPETTLASDCYSGMFTKCTSLETAPELPATTLVSNCYKEMFSGCTKLNYIKALFTTTPSNTYTKSWVLNVPATGTFVKSADASWDVTGDNGIPTGWTVTIYL